MDQYERKYQRLLDDIRAEFPGFRIVKKDESALQRFIHHLLTAVTLGSQRQYMSTYQTTIGRTVYVTPDWDSLPPAQRYVTMRHERMHLRQFRRYTLVGMSLLYLLVPLPVGLAWFRARFEKEGYEESIRAGAEVWGIDHVRRASFKEHVIGQFTGGSYGWMWPFRRGLDRWYDGVVASLERN